MLTGNPLNTKWAIHTYCINKHGIIYQNEMLWSHQISHIVDQSEWKNPLQIVKFKITDKNYMDGEGQYHLLANNKV